MKMKSALLVASVVLCLVSCEGRISKYRTTSMDQDLEDGSFEEDYSDVSLDDTEEYPGVASRERTLRASVYEPEYGYSKSYKRKRDRDSDYEGAYEQKKPKHSATRSRGKDYKKGTHKSYKKDSVSELPGSKPEYRDRKKDHRSAPRYESEYPQAPSSLMVPPYYKPQPAKKECNQQLVISCTPTVTKLPCDHHIKGEPYHVPEPVYHDQPKYHPQYPEPQPSYGHRSPNYYEQPAVHHAPAKANYPAIQHEPAYNPQPTHTGSVNHQPGFSHVDPYSHQHKPVPPPPAVHPSYPIYKPKEQSKPHHHPNTPSYAPPVNEDFQEPPHTPPFVSAFPTTTINPPPKPPRPTTTTPTSWDQGQEEHQLQRANAKQTTPTPTSPAPAPAPFPVDPYEKEASGDDPEGKDGGAAADAKVAQPAYRVPNVATTTTTHSPNGGSTNGAGTTIAIEESALPPPAQ